MAFKYINPGLSNMFDLYSVYGQDIYTANKNLSKTGVFSHNGLGYIYPPDNMSKRLFVKFDSLIQTTYYPWSYIEVCYSNNKRISVGFRDGTFKVIDEISGNSQSGGILAVSDGIGLVSNYFYIIPEDNRYRLKYYRDGLALYNTDIETTAAKDLYIKSIYLYSGWYSKSSLSAGGMSNIIISDEPFDRSEQVIKIPVNISSDTIQKNSEGLYETAIESQVEITPDRSVLDSVNNDNSITGVLLVNNKLYRDGAGVDGLSYYVNGERCKDSEINTDSRFKSYASKALNKQSLEDFVDNNRFSLNLNQYAYD